MVKRLCLFAGYSKHGIIEDYVLYYLKALSKFADICYCADCDISPKELEKIVPFTKMSLACRHSRYDFGSWELLYSKVPDLEKYDELILTNDSVFGPLYSLDTIFEQMENKNLDAWGLCGNKFMMSFFVVLKQSVFLAPWFADFMAKIKAGINKEDIVRLYEKGLSQLIKSHGLSWDCLFSKKTLKNKIRAHKKEVDEAKKLVPLLLRLWHRCRFNKVRLYDDDFFGLLCLGFPFIKKHAFAMNTNHFNTLAPLFIKKYTDFDYHLISSCLELNEITPRAVPFSVRLKKAVKNFIFEKKYKGKGIVYKVLKIKVYVKKHTLEN